MQRFRKNLVTLFYIGSGDRRNHAKYRQCFALRSVQRLRLNLRFAGGPPAEFAVSEKTERIVELIGPDAKTRAQRPRWALPDDIFPDCSLNRRIVHVGEVIPGCVVLADMLQAEPVKSCQLVPRPRRAIGARFPAIRVGARRLDRFRAGCAVQNGAVAIAFSRHNGSMIWDKCPCKDVPFAMIEYIPYLKDSDF